MAGIVIPALIGVNRYRHLLPEIKIMAWAISLSFLGDMATLISIRYLGNNMMAMNVYVIVESLVLLRFFYVLHKKNWETGYWILNALFIIGGLLDSPLFRSKADFNFLFQLFSAIILSCLTINGLNKTVVNERPPLFVSQRFLSLLGLLFYWPMRSFLILFFILGRLHTPYVGFATAIFAVFNLAYNGFVAWGFCCKKPRPSLAVWFQTRERKPKSKMRSGKQYNLF